MSYRKKEEKEYMPFKKYRHEPSNPHNFKLICIPIQPVVKLVWTRGGNIKENRAYIKVDTKPSHSVMQIFSKLCEVYVSDKISYETDGWM